MKIPKTFIEIIVKTDSYFNEMSKSPSNRIGTLTSNRYREIEEKRWREIEEKLFQFSSAINAKIENKSTGKDNQTITSRLGYNFLKIRSMNDYNVSLDDLGCDHKVRLVN